ncbi:DUF397 domain-containing protein [Streptomyces fuscichromogenes]|uniref:Toxin n=1 Tax=Streptomyces fuscichromogenes TaxID=1324013 RepID=A0A917UJV8_9ACTN|nr:DUF397 domain-containing protein [Streptomyces fuscichromogenes]GGM95000.1 toxin [Streptomyces fuscichromogenes]
MSTSNLSWFKSSYSSGGDGDCVEVALSWHKSSYSSASGDNCVEVSLSWPKSVYSIGGSGDCVDVGTRPATIHIRDSKNRQGPQLTVSPDAWAGFLTHAGR